MNMHRPPHILIDDSWFFVTAHTITKEPLLSFSGHKQLLSQLIVESTQLFSINVAAWVVLDNHYHILVHFSHSSDLPLFVNRLHGISSYRFNQREGCQGRKVWYSYWDRVIRNESDYWTKFNYIHYNPVKHGYVQAPNDWQCSTFNKYLKEKGEDWIADCWQSYPVIECDWD